jgi:ribonucleoside-diphosphate reductase alpha chain
MFLKEWTALIESKSGERGIFSRYAVASNMPERRDAEHEFGTNPCSEIILRSRQFCNLTEVVAREGDGVDELKAKIELATILGTIQSTFTDFRYLGKRWKDNCEDERLLGVSLTGIMDCPYLRCATPEQLEELRDHAIETNKKWAKKMGISPSAAITCVKPSGTVSQLVGSSSGIHPRYANYYIRRVRGDNKDPLTQSLIEQGVPNEPDNHAPETTVFSFPIEAPSSAITIQDYGAIPQLEMWKRFALHWCEHKPSVSIYVKDNEWLEVGAWVYENFDIMSGVSFFPHDDHIYPQAPYEAVDEATYRTLKAEHPEELSFQVNEAEDNTTSSQELACHGGACEL